MRFHIGMRKLQWILIRISCVGEERNVIAFLTPNLPSLKTQFSEFELRIPKLAKQSVSKSTNLLFLYQPWILCDSERERERERERENLRA